MNRHAFVCFIVGLLCCYVSSECPEHPVNNLEEIAGLKLDLIPLRQTCEGNFFADFNFGGACNLYWTKMSALNLAIEKHMCWLGATYQQIIETSSETTLGEVKVNLESVLELLKVSGEVDLKTKIDLMETSLETIAKRILDPLLDKSRFTSQSEFETDVQMLEAKVIESVGNEQDGTLGNLGAAFNTFLGDIGILLGLDDGSLHSQLTSSVQNLKQQTIVAAAEVKDRLQNKLTASRDIMVEFYLSQCTGTYGKPLPPYLKISPSVGQVIDLVQDRKDRASAAGYTIGSYFDTYLNRARSYKDSTRDSYRITALRNAALAYQLIGSGQYPYDTC